VRRHRRRGDKGVVLRVWGHDHWSGDDEGVLTIERFLLSTHFR